MFIPQLLYINDNYIKISTDSGECWPLLIVKIIIYVLMTIFKRN